LAGAPPGLGRGAIRVRHGGERQELGTGLGEHQFVEQACCAVQAGVTRPLRRERGDDFVAQRLI
jgi:hypothetical protein